MRPASPDAQDPPSQIGSLSGAALLGSAALLEACGGGGGSPQTRPEPDAVTAIQSQLGVARAGELVEHALSEIAKGLVKAGVRQLVVAGGETSGAVVQALDVQRMVIGPQIDPGVPWTTVSSPVCDGDTVHVALKSGNFGSTDFFSKSLAMLKAI